MRKIRAIGRRILAERSLGSITLGVIAAIVGLLVITIALAGESKDPYLVRAVFDNAGFVLPGEDVKVAGVKVGQVRSVELTRDNKAAIVLDIQEPGYRDFRSDASCNIRPQSLIGERFVECRLSRRPDDGGVLSAKPLKEISSGDGEGQRLLPVSHTSKSVDLDLINNIMRQPQTERLSLIINELGVGLAGRGKDLNSVIRRANPALKELDEVLKILASQNQTLSQLAKDGDTVLVPLTKERRHLGGLVGNANKVAQSTVDQGAALEKTIERLPRFLRELRPTMRQLGGLADDMNPLLADLQASAPEINRITKELGPFARAGKPALESLGKAAEVGTPAIKAVGPDVKRVRTLAATLGPLSYQLAALFRSLNRTGGIERLMDFFFYQANAINGFDSFGHYVRAALVVNTCANYAVTEQKECLARVTKVKGAEKGELEADATDKKTNNSGSVSHSTKRQSGKKNELMNAGQSASVKQPTSQPGKNPGVIRKPSKAQTAQTKDSSEELMDYLFGSDR